MKKEVLLTWLWITVFAIAMGFMESAAVVYLRTIFYPEGFAFPLKTITHPVGITEIIREGATIIMLITIAILSVKSSVERFAVFIYAFAIWDLGYYLFLWLLIGWPLSFYTWDILFLIPVTWVGPVLAPVINSFTMILLAFIIVHSKAKHILFKLKFLEWFLLVTGSLITIFGYTRSFLHFMNEKFTLTDLLTFTPSKEMINYSSRFVPVSFDWPAFILGECLFLLAFLLIILRSSRK